jgi:hypothetical protein
MIGKRDILFRFYPIQRSGHLAGIAFSFTVLTAPRSMR